MSYLQNLSPMGVQPIRPPRIDDQTGALRVQMLRNQAAIENQSRAINANSFMQDKRLAEDRRANAVAGLAKILESQPNIPVPKGLTEMETATMAGSQQKGNERLRRQAAMSQLLGSEMNAFRAHSSQAAILNEEKRILDTRAPRDQIKLWLESEASKDFRKSQEWKQIEKAAGKGQDIPPSSSPYFKLLQNKYIEQTIPDFSLKSYLENYAADQGAKQVDRRALIRDLIQAGYYPQGQASTMSPMAGSVEGVPDASPDFNSAEMPTGIGGNNEKVFGLPNNNFIGTAGKAIGYGIPSYKAYKGAQKGIGAINLKRASSVIDQFGSDKVEAMKKTALSGGAANLRKELADLAAMQVKLLEANNIDVPSNVRSDPKALAVLVQDNADALKKMPKGISAASKKAISSGLMGNILKVGGKGIAGAFTGPVGWAAALWTLWDIYGMVAEDSRDDVKGAIGETWQQLTQ